ncbi:MAG: DUF484 family protein [Pseudomonadales bacterium]
MTMEQTKDALDAEQVAQYLKQNRNFFVDRDELLLDMTLRHDSGSAVSLMERQVGLLRERNIDMRHRLASLTGAAKENDELLARTQRLVLALLEAEDIDAVVAAVKYSMEQDFKVDVSELTLFAEPGSQTTARVVPISEAQQHIDGLLKSRSAICGTLRPTELSFLFPGHGDEIGSAAVAPLSNGSTIGILAIGSFDPEYYRSSMGTLFLTYVSEVLNRILPRFLS